MRRRRFAACTLSFASLVFARGSFAQSVPGDFVTPGSTVATANDADAARINPGAVPLIRWFSGRLTGAAEFRSQRTALGGAALSIVQPLPFDLGLSASVSWQHALTGAARGDVVTGDIGLGMQIARALGLGVRLRVMGAAGDGAFASIASGAAALDAGLAWRAYNWLAFGLVGRNLVGPQIPAIGLQRAVVGGVAIRPTGTDVLSLGIDGSFAEGNTGYVRGAARVRLPSVGYVVADGVVDLPTRAWRASAGIEVDFGTVGAALGALAGQSTGASQFDVTGAWGSVRFEALRERGLPTGGVLVALSTGDLGARELAHLVITLERFTHDPSVRGIVWTPRGEAGGIEHGEELRDAFDRFRATGRHVFCHVTRPAASTYAACAGAETVSMEPNGEFRSAGLHTSFIFLGDTLRDVGVRTQFLRIGVWKSAPEQFTRGGSTPAARAQEEQLVDDYYAHLLDGIAHARAGADHAWTPASVRTLIEGGPYTAHESLAHAIVDVLATRDRALDAASHRAHAPVIEWGERTGIRPLRWGHGRSVAVVHVDGDMVDGDSFEFPLLGMRFVGDRTVRATLESLANDDSVGAIVLRIDSGGGTATSAEAIWRTLARITRHKTVIVSVGRMAASAAYYIAAPAREVVAEPSSVVGSIGIFIGRADLSPLLSRLDVGIETIQRGVHADYESMFHAWSHDEERLVGHLVEDGYQVFLSRVAAGRHMSVAAVHRIGEGRVFTGARGAGNGLVDRVGGLWLAIERARELAHIPGDSEIREYPAQSPGLLESLVSLVASASTNDPQPLARLVTAGQSGAVLRWLYAVSLSHGAPMAMIETPLDLP